METILRKVDVKERLPEKGKEHFFKLKDGTKGLGYKYFAHNHNACIFIKHAGSFNLDKVECWYEELEVPVTGVTDEETILGLNNSWPLKDVLSKLVFAADYLLHEKDYDGHSHEEILLCLSRGKDIIKELSKLSVTGSKPLKTDEELLKQAKDNVAKNRGYKSFNELESESHLVSWTNVIDEVFEEYLRLCKGKE